MARACPHHLESFEILESHALGAASRSKSRSLIGCWMVPSIFLSNQISQFINLAAFIG